MCTRVDFLKLIDKCFWLELSCLCAELWLATWPKALHDLAYTNGEPNNHPLPIGPIPTALIYYLTIVVGITTTNMAPTLTAIATTDAYAHQFLNQTKLAAISNFRSNIGIPSPSPSTGAYPTVDLCSHCQKATPTRWFIGRPSDDEDFLTESLLQQCYTNYIKKITKTTKPCSWKPSSTIHPSISGETVSRSGCLCLLAVCLPSPLCTPTLQQPKHNKNREDNTPYLP